MTTSVPPYSRVASVSSILFRAACYIFFRIIPGRVAPPFIAFFYSIYALAYWLGGRQVPALDRAKLEAAKAGQANGHHEGPPPIRKHRDTDNAPGTTMLLTLPTSSRMLRRISFAANTVLLLMALDFVSKPHFQPALDLTFARVGAVDSTSAKIVVRYPAAPEPPTTSISTSTPAPSPTPSIIEAIHDAVDGIMPEITLPAKVEELLAPQPSPRTTSLRVQWRQTGPGTGLLDSAWTDGPTVEMSEARDWVGMAKLTGLQASAEYEYRLVELDGTPWSSSTLSFRTTPDPRLTQGSRFRFVSTSCVIPNFPYSAFIKGTRIKGFDLLADHIWPPQPESKEPPTKAQEQLVPPPTAEESPDAVAHNTEPAATSDGLPSSTSTQVPITPSPLDDTQSPIVFTELPPPKTAPVVEFLMMMGDFIYADVPYYFGDTLQAYRRLYRRVYASKSFRKLYERLPVYNIYDDHDFILQNNFGANGNDSTPPFPNASRAYDLYNGQANPDSKTNGVYYYDFRYGDTAFFVMDTRRYRSPPRPRKPYPFPISLFTPLIQAVAEGRNPFASLFGEPDGPNVYGEATDENARTMLGEAQLAALHAWVADVNRTAAWKFVVSSVPLTAMWGGYDGHEDLWAGYPHERETVLSLLSSVPNVVVLSGDRHEFAAIEFPRGKYVVREFSTSPLNQFYVPLAYTLSPKNAGNVNVTRTKEVTTETGEVNVEEYVEEVPEENLIKYIPQGNHKWTTFEVDSTDPNAPTLKAELYVNGKLEWEYMVEGDPVELTHPTSLVIPAQVQGVVESLKKSFQGWFRSS
ncbi:hypothetical protein CTheo_922 [Ceratobasidium theobromae]|uniref:PhoD-like phosphatase metallophosphatase domain-containing protein n=1 Tax=Ceratobasidium theobromae TaxID=1582974 RepID=A0A5N5QVI1_9AGAM|nr:hypothetical protein CTheo_922 [Ceratobasidium theobromae]